MIEPKSYPSSYYIDIPLDVIWYHPEEGITSVCISSNCGLMRVDVGADSGEILCSFIVMNGLI